MSDHQHDRRGSAAGTHDPAGHDAAAPGRSTLAMELEDAPADASADAPVQMRIAGPGDAAAQSPGQVRHAAQRGLAGSGGSLPFLDQIQRSFGRHDVSGLQAHTDAPAVAGARAMGADAFASGQRIAFAKAPDLHTAAHEAAHAVQQRAGVQLSGGVGAVGDVHERHADEVADRVVAGRSAEDLLDRYAAGPRPVSLGAAVQHKITRPAAAADGKASEYPTTWKAIKAGKAQAEDVLAAAKALLAKKSPVDDTRLQGSWGKVAKKEKTLDVVANRDELIAAIVKSYNLSATSSKRAAGKKTAQVSLTGPILAEHKDLEFKSSARNPLLVADPMATFRSTPAASQDEKAVRTQTHLSTVLLHTLDEGEEGQAALARDGSGVMPATNTNSANDRLRALIKRRRDIEAMSAQLAIARNLAKLTRRAAMDDVIVRHAMKLFERLKIHMKDDALVHVPASVAVKFDGQHAELRIVQDKRYSRHEYYLPTGTKYPCAGCKLTLVRKGMSVGVEMGPMWLTNAALSTQLGGKKIDNLGDDHDKVAKLIAAEYAAAIEAGAQMGYGKPKKGAPSADRNADSDSEYDDDGFDKLRAAMLAHGSAAAAAAGAGGAGPKPEQKGAGKPKSKDDKESKGGRGKGGKSKTPSRRGGGGGGSRSSDPDSFAGQLLISAMLGGEGRTKQVSFESTIRPSGILTFVDVVNSSGDGNNCLIFSIARELGVVPTAEQILAIRRACGNLREFLGVDDIPAILTELGQAAQVVVIDTTAPHVRGRFGARVAGSGRTIFVVNAHDLHFGSCKLKSTVRAVVGAGHVTFAVAADEKGARGAAPGGSAAPASVRDDSGGSSSSARKPRERGADDDDDEPVVRASPAVVVATGGSSSGSGSGGGGGGGGGGHDEKGSKPLVGSWPTAETAPVGDGDGDGDDEKPRRKRKGRDEKAARVSNVPKQHRGESSRGGRGGRLGRPARPPKGSVVVKSKASGPKPKLEDDDQPEHDDDAYEGDDDSRA